ncbi:class D sortase [Enterococcus hirae]|uniref:class D sortase n=1 Tax=Enterococcus TaxID=1350 RepID=UPI0009BE7CD4|nr:class D sortase [Enterococcus hirae]
MSKRGIKGGLNRIVNGCLLAFLFLVINYSLIYVIGKPVIHFVTSSIQTLLLAEAPTFKENNHKEAIKQLSTNGESEISSSKIQFPHYGQLYGEISVPSIQLKTPLYFGDSATILRKGAGQYMGSTFPGEIGTTLIAGLNSDSFGKLINIKAQEIITIQTNYGSYQYEVEEVRVANKHDTQIKQEIRQRNNAKLILYTCYPIDSIGLTDQRLFVTAKLHAGPMINENK